MRLTTKMFVAYLQTLTDIHVAIGRMPDMPDRAIAVTKTSGGGEILDGAFEEITYRIQTRGIGSNVEDAEGIALMLDDALDGTSRFDIDDVYVLTVFHLASPRQINMTDPQSRFNFTADYRVTASRH